MVKPVIESRHDSHNTTRSFEIIKIRNNVDTDFVGSRYAGEIIRNLMDKTFKEKKKVILDFKGISGITQSFGDEIVGIYTREFGTNWVKENIKVKNANEKIRKILNWVVGYSKK